ncbi:hypothetical protein JCM10914A_32040 [Paenibacillus sp. JCM 10914]
MQLQAEDNGSSSPYSRAQISHAERYVNDAGCRIMVIRYQDEEDYEYVGGIS